MKMERLFKLLSQINCKIMYFKIVKPQDATLPEVLVRIAPPTEDNNYTYSVIYESYGYSQKNFMDYEYIFLVIDFKTMEQAKWQLESSEEFAIKWIQSSDFLFSEEDYKRQIKENKQK